MTSQTFVLLALMLTGGAAQPEGVHVGPESPHQAVEELLALESKVMKAIAAKDRATLQPILSEAFVLRMPGAPDAGREQFLASIGAVPGRIESIRGEGVQARLVGDVGIVTGVQVATVRLDEGGQVVTSRGAFTDVFERVDGHWRLTLAFSVELPAE